MEIKQKLESTIGSEELQQRISQARSRTSGSISESGSVADRRSLNGSLHRYFIIILITLLSFLKNYLKV